MAVTTLPRHRVHDSVQHIHFRTLDLNESSSDSEEDSSVGPRNLVIHCDDTANDRSFLARADTSLAREVLSTQNDTIQITTMTSVESSPRKVNMPANENHCKVDNNASAEESKVIISVFPASNDKQESAQIASANQVLMLTNTYRKNSDAAKRNSTPTSLQTSHSPYLWIPSSQNVTIVHDADTPSIGVISKDMAANVTSNHTQNSSISHFSWKNYHSESFDAPYANNSQSINQVSPDLSKDGYTNKKSKKLSRRDRRKLKSKNKKIDKRHPEFELTYDMMLGIRTAVSKIESIHRGMRLEELNFSDKRRSSYALQLLFEQFTRYRFPGSGSNLTPAHLMRDFSFKDYAPEIFRVIRQSFGIEPADYLMNVCGSFQYLEFISNSKSGAFFFYSHDRHYMIKTISKTESKFLRRILPAYWQHIVANPHTLLPKFFGLHRVKPHKKSKIYFLIMQSVFFTQDPAITVLASYDLKGSLQGRIATAAERQTRTPVYKDLDFLADGTAIRLSKDKAQMLILQLEKDTAFLSRTNIMDYSLLLGIGKRVSDTGENTADVSSNMATDSQQLSHRSPTASSRIRSNISPPRMINFIHRNSRIEDGLSTALQNDSALARNVLGPSLTIDLHSPSRPNAVYVPHADSLYDNVSNCPTTLTLEHVPNQLIHRSHLDQNMSSQFPNVSEKQPNTPMQATQDCALTNTGLSPIRRIGHYGVPGRYDQLSRPLDINFDPPEFDLTPFENMKHESHDEILINNRLSKDVIDHAQSSFNRSDGCFPSPNQLQHHQTALDQSNIDTLQLPQQRVSQTPTSSRSSMHPAPVNETSWLRSGSTFESHIMADVRKRSVDNDPSIVSECMEFWSEDSSEVYFMGIIDILSSYGVKKRIEHLVKGFQYDRTSISAVPPQLYAERFLDFIKRLSRPFNYFRCLS